MAARNSFSSFFYPSPSVIALYQYYYFIIASQNLNIIENMKFE